MPKNTTAILAMAGRTVDENGRPFDGPADDLRAEGPTGQRRTKLGRLRTRLIVSFDGYDIIWMLKEQDKLSRDPAPDDGWYAVTAEEVPLSWEIILRRGDKIRMANLASTDRGLSGEDRHYELMLRPRTAMDYLTPDQRALLHGVVEMNSRNILEELRGEPVGVRNLYPEQIPNENESTVRLDEFESATNLCPETALRMLVLGWPHYISCLPKDLRKDAGSYYTMQNELFVDALYRLREARTRF